MKIAKYPFAVLSAALFTVMLMTPISSLSNLLWLASVDMPVGLFSSLEVILFDFQRLGIILFAVVTIGFTIAFAVAGLISKYSSLGWKYLFAVAGSVAIGAALILMVELLFQTQLLGGNRTLIGSILHWAAGFFGGYFFYSLISKEKNYTFFVIEHDMDLIEKICDPVIVMAEGSVLFRGNFQEVKNNENVIEAYLGKGIKKNN